MQEPLSVDAAARHDPRDDQVAALVLPHCQPQGLVGALPEAHHPDGVHRVAIFLGHEGGVVVAAVDAVVVAVGGACVARVSAVGDGVVGLEEGLGEGGGLGGEENQIPFPASFGLREGRKAAGGGCWGLYR